VTLTAAFTEQYWLWPPYVIGHAIKFLPSFFLLSFFPRLVSAAADWMSSILWHLMWPWCEFRMQVWNMLHAARWKYRSQKWRKNRHLRTIAQLCRAISAELRHLSTIGKNLLSSNTSSTCPDNMVNFEFGSPLQMSTGFASWQRYCTASSSGRQPNFAALNRGCHLYSAGRRSRWALAHISSLSLLLSVRLCIPLRVCVCVCSCWWRW